MDKHTCKIIGHKLPRGYKGQLPLLKITNTSVDLYKRKQAFLESTCERCGQKWQVGTCLLP